ncbi:MAG: lipid-A-disaccharide synthase [Pseudomonadota bacterium]
MSPRRQLTVLLTALEPSGDAIGADVMAALRAQRPDVRFIGCGGQKMAAAGLTSLFPISDFSVMGLTDVARIFLKAFEGARDIAHLAHDEEPDAAVLIDSWGFSRLVATRLKALSPETKRIKLAAPQVWATRPERKHFVARNFDGVLCLLPFEPEIFEKAGARAAFIGNPNFAAAAAARPDARAFRARHGLGAAPVLSVLLGSREGEVKRLAPTFGKTVERIATRVPGLKVVAPLAPAVAKKARHEVKYWPVPVLTIEPEEKFDAFAYSTAALVASGTVTTELAIHGVPMVAAYKVDRLTEFWLRRSIICDYASIVNIAADAEIIPERLQENCTPEKLEETLYPLLTDKAARAAQLDAARPVVERLLARAGGVHAPGPAAAAKILEWTGV